MAMTAEQKDELEEIVKQGMHDALRDLGFNTTEVFEIRKDFTFLREWRLSCESVKDKGLWAFVWFLITGILGLVIFGINSYFGK